MARKEGWTGRVFEDFEVGEVYEHALGRTVTTADNIWFTALTMNPNPIHFDHAYAARTDWKKPLVNSCLTLGLVTGLSVADISQNGVNLGWDEVRMPKPVFEGDTLYARTRGAREARVGLAAASGNRSLPHRGLQPGRHRRHRVRAHRAGLQGRARATGPARRRA